MIKKLICLAGLVVMMSCARSTTGAGTSSIVNTPDPDPDPVVTTQYTSLWASVGGDEGASNTVSGRLPSLTGIEAVSSAEAGFNVYASPVIFSDDSGNQYVIALWVNDSSAKLVKYDYKSTVLTKDTDFESATFSSNATGFKAHQISLLVSDSEVFVYVGHGDGISKINALTGEVISSSDVRGAHYSMLVYNNKVYATTATQIVEYESSLSSAIARSLGTDEIPSIGFPLVVSGEYIYAAKPSTIFKIDLPSDGIGSSITTFTVDNALSTDVETLSNIVAYNNDGIIYSSIYSFVSYNYNFTTTVHGFFGSTTHNDGEADFEFYSENRRINSETMPHGNTAPLSRSASVLGDASYTMLATSGTSVYLSGYYIFNEEFNYNIDDGAAGATPNAGVVSFTPENVSDIYANQVDEKATSFFINNELLEVELVKDYTSLGGFLSNKVYFSTRFFILDESTGQALSVQNINESFFDLNLNSTTYSNSGSSAWGDLVDDTNYSNEFENYNSRIMIGNSSEVASEAFTDISLEVDSIAVGNNMAVVSASDGKLYLIK